MGESFYRATEHMRGVDEGRVCQGINERMGKFSRERLRDGERREIAIGNNNSSFSVEKRSEFRLKLGVDSVISCGQAGGGHVQAVFAQSRARGERDRGMPRQAKIVATGKINERPVSPADFVGTDHLQRLRLSHGLMISFGRLDRTREYSGPSLDRSKNICHRKLDSKATFKQYGADV